MAEELGTKLPRRLATGQLEAALLVYLGREGLALLSLPRHRERLAGYDDTQLRNVDVAIGVGGVDGLIAEGARAAPIREAQLTPIADRWMSVDESAIAPGILEILVEVVRPEMSRHPALAKQLLELPACHPREHARLPSGRTPRW